MARARNRRNVAGQPETAGPGFVDGVDFVGLGELFFDERFEIGPGVDAHSAQWEFYMVVAGRGQVRTPAGKVEVRAGDCFSHPPGEPHQLTNTGATDLIYYVIADNPVSDAWHYPDSHKWKVPGQAKPVRVTPAEYYDGEE